MRRTDRVGGVPASVVGVAIALKRGEAGVSNVDGETGLESGDAGDMPATEDGSSNHVRPVTTEVWNLVIVIDHEPLPRVVGRITSAQSEIERIFGALSKAAVLKPRCVVNGMAEGVAGLKGKTMGEALPEAQLPWCRLATH